MIDCSGLNLDQPIYSESLTFNPFIRRDQDLCQIPGEKVPWIYQYLKKMETAFGNWPENHWNLMSVRVRRFADELRSEHQAWSTPNATWRRMYILASLVKWSDDEEIPYATVKNVVTFTIRDTTGITLGLLEDVFSRVCASPVPFDDNGKAGSDGRLGGGLFGLLAKCN